MSKRVFLGFGTTTEQTQALLQLQSHCGCDGRAVPAANFHLTLKFLGQISESQVQALIQGIDKLSRQQRLTRFQVALTELAHWPKPRVLCLKGDVKREDAKNEDFKEETDALPPHETQALMTLYQVCQSLCQQLEIAGDEHSFTPHITLFRKATNYRKISITPLLLQPTSLHLYQSVSSETGVCYPILHSWPLVA